MFTVRHNETLHCEEVFDNDFGFVVGMKETTKGESRKHQQACKALQSKLSGLMEVENE